MSVLPLGSPPTSVRFFSESTERPDHPHCPLCIDDMVHPADDLRPPAFIFLDMDGVLLGDRSSLKYHKKMSQAFFRMFPGERRCNEYQSVFVKAELLNTNAVDYLGHLMIRVECAGYRALIVLITSWRNVTTVSEFKEKVFANHLSISKYLCGKVAPSESDANDSVESKQGFQFTEGAKEIFNLELAQTADAIEYWLRDHGFDPGTTNFVVVDDDETRGYKRFGPRFIKPFYSLKEKDVEQAAIVLNV